MTQRQKNMIRGIPWLLMWAGWIAVLVVICIDNGKPEPRDWYTQWHWTTIHLGNGKIYHEGY